MQGILIASADVPVRRSLAAIVGSGKTIYECSTCFEVLALAAAQRIDCFFVDDVFKDGAAADLAARLHALGYGTEIVPILLSDDLRYLQPFRPYGVRYYVRKPFDVHHVTAVVDQIEAALRASGGLALPDADESGPGLTVQTASESESAAVGAARDIDIREVSQRFRRLLARSLQPEDLIIAFAEAMQEQFDVDNVTVLLPAPQEPCFRVACGHMDPEVRRQLAIPLADPLVAALIRLGGPLWLDELHGFDADTATTAVRYGERLGVRVLCPVISRGRVLAIVGLSRVHRYAGSPFLVSLLRLFLTFFAKALENAELHTQVATAEQSYRTVFDALPAGAILLAPDGAIRHLNHSAAQFLGTSSEELEGHPIERAGSQVADLARQVLAGARTATAASIRIGAHGYSATAVPLRETGALVLLEPPGVETTVGANAQKTAAVDEILEDMSRVLAHNFKNALVPIKTCAELLPERYAQEAFRSSFFAVVRESIDKIDGWITRLLRISAPVAEPGTNEQTVAFRDQLERGLKQALAAFPNSQVTIVRDYADGDWVRAKADIFAKMFAEICCNALDATQDIPEPKLHLTIRYEQDHVIARVSDNGKGLDKDTRESVFRPFLTSKLSGLGLGLTYVRKVAAAAGGTVQIEPGPEAGTVVSVTVPAAAAPVPLSVEKRAG